MGCAEVRAVKCHDGVEDRVEGHHASLKKRKACDHAPHGVTDKRQTSDGFVFDKVQHVASQSGGELAE